MMGKTLMTAFAGLAAIALNGAAAEAACEAGKPRAEMSYQDAQALYDCLAGPMYEAYNQNDKRWIPAEIVRDYRSWDKANTLPADPGFHGERYLITYVNATGYDAYTEFRDENVEIPAGTVIAKESFQVSEDGRATAGPLFLMQKTEPGASPDTLDWYYMMVMPNGAPAAINVYSACSACHMENFGAQGGLGYPVEEVRVSR